MECGIWSRNGTSHLELSWNMASELIIEHHILIGHGTWHLEWSWNILSEEVITTGVV